MRTDISWAGGAASGRFDSALARLGVAKMALYAFVASRLALLAVGLMAQIFIEPFSSQVSPVHLTEQAALRIWGQWDAGWYYSIATQGYSSHPGADGQANWVFFPAFPLLSAGLAKITHLPVFPTMILLANVCFFAALALLHRLAREEFDERTADITAALVCAAPGSYIYSSAYTESLFLLALVGCLLMLRRGRWLAAGAFAALATLTRNLGVGLVLPFLFAAVPPLLALARRASAGDPAARRRLASEGLRTAAGLAMPALALAAFCLLLYLACGDPFAFVTGQKAWGRSLVFPLRRLLGPVVRGTLADGDLVNFAAAWLALALLAALALMRRWSLLVLACFLVLVPLSSGLTSFARYSLVAAPLFMAGAKLLAPRPAATAAVLIVFATINGFMVTAWTLGMWLTA